jgi:hypothetical protein
VGKGVGGAVFAQLGPDEFLVAGSNVRVRIALDAAAAGENALLLRVEEGRYDKNRKWTFLRVWNGDSDRLRAELQRRPDAVARVHGALSVAAENSQKLSCSRGVVTSAVRGATFSAAPRVRASRRSRHRA